MLGHSVALRRWWPVLLVAAAIAAGCNSDSEPNGPTQLIDEDAGTFRGVGLGDSGTDVIRALGEAQRSREPAIAPLERDLEDLDAAPSWDCRTNDLGDPRSIPETFQYDTATYTLGEDQVCDFIVVDSDARTRRGVGIGDPLDRVAEVYPRLTCGTANDDTDYREFPYCAGAIGADRYIWFGGDPINTIQLDLGPLRE